MNLLKSLFVSAFLNAAWVGTGVAVVQLWRSGWASPWLGTAIACAGPALFFARLFLLPVARTSAGLPGVLLAGLAGTGLAWALSGGSPGAPVWIAAAVGIAGSAAYIYWYSRFAPADGIALRVGAPLPGFDLWEGGRRLASADLLARPALWLFYRGNWCPLCMAQIREVAAQYRELARRGVEIYVVSPQPESHTAALAARFAVPMRFLTDRDNAAAATLGVLEKNGLPAGMQLLGYDADVPRPTVFITAPGGTVLYADLTDNYRLRPEPAQFLAVLDRHAIV